MKTRYYEDKEFFEYLLNQIIDNKNILFQIEDYKVDLFLKEWTNAWESRDIFKYRELRRLWLRKRLMN